jgi:predicted aspartyl protease
VRYFNGPMNLARCRVAVMSLLAVASCAQQRTAAVPVAPSVSVAHSLSPSDGSQGARPLFSRFKAVTGGDAWDGVSSVETRGTLRTGGLSGPFVTTEDFRAGRSASRYTLGSVTGASGFDGASSWTEDPGGEISTLDAPEAKEIARTEAWLTMAAYWYPSRASASFGPPRPAEEGGRRYHTVVATPAGGRATTLWFDDASGLLVRTVTRHGADTSTTHLDDYRSVGGVRIAFHSVTDSTDAAGRTDPRERVEVRTERAVTNVKLDDAVFAVPNMAPNARIVDASGSTTVPFELINNHIYASASIDGKPVRVLVDTGGSNLLTPSAAERLGIRGEGKLAGSGAGDGHVDVALAHAGEVRLGNAVLAKPVFYIIDLGSLAAGEGTPSDGLVGFEMFRRFRVSIDYAAHTLTLTEPARFTPPAGAHVVKFDMAERIPVVQGTLDGVPVRLSIDTGSRSSLTLHSPFVGQHDLAKHYGAAPETVTGWGVGGASRARPARLGSLALGDVTIRDIAGDLFTGNKGAFANPDLSGNLGGGVLRRFTVAFDYDAKRMYLVPNADFAKPDPFDRSGMWLFRDGDALEVVAISPGGPAEKAGIAQGDRLVRVAGEPTSKRTLADWRAMLRELPPGTRLEVSLVRGGRERSAVLTLTDLIPPHA